MVWGRQRSSRGLQEEGGLITGEAMELTRQLQCPPDLGGWVSSVHLSSQSSLVLLEAIGRKEARKEGRKEGSGEGRKEGRKGGKKGGLNQAIDSLNGPRILKEGRIQIKIFPRV